MSDRNAAALYGRIFEYLARTPDDPAARKFAAEVWEMKERAGDDFSDYQMDADEDLEALGLSRLIDTNDGQEREYGPA